MVKNRNPWTKRVNATVVDRGLLEPEMQRLFLTKIKNGKRVENDFRAARGQVGFAFTRLGLVMGAQGCSLAAAQLAP
jgi:hypothetical protein